WNLVPASHSYHNSLPKSRGDRKPGVLVAHRQSCAHCGGSPIWLTHPRLDLQNRHTHQYGNTPGNLPYIQVLTQPEISNHPGGYQLQHTDYPDTRSINAT